MQYTLAQLARMTGVHYNTVFNQMKRGYCPWPRRSITGQSNDAAYKCWENMVQRATNPKATGYENYGGRGITLHPTFLSFSTFIEHIGPRPSPTHSIDRIDVNGNYEPGNVRWATPIEQAANKNELPNTKHGIELHGRKYRFDFRGKIHSFPTYEEALEAKLKLKGNWGK